MTNLLAYLGLFATAFGAATILPMQSEAVLVGLVMTEKFSIFWLLVIASAGNVLGSVANWILGRGIESFRKRHWFPVSSSALDRAQGWYRKYGRWSLLGSWLPIVGDPITVVAGVMKEPLPAFILLVGIAKTSRYVALAWATSGLT